MRGIPGVTHCGTWRTGRIEGVDATRFVCARRLEHPGPHQSRWSLVCWWSRDGKLFVRKRFYDEVGATR